MKREWWQWMRGWCYNDYLLGTVLLSFAALKLHLVICFTFTINLLNPCAELNGVSASIHTPGLSLEITSLAIYSSSKAIVS